MKLKEALDVLLEFATWLEEQQEKQAAQKPVTMDDLADALWKGDFEHEFASKQEFKDYMHRLLKSDLFAKERMAKSE